MTEPDNTPVVDAPVEAEITPVPSAPEVQDAASDGPQDKAPYEAPEVNSQPVSAVPTPGALSDPQPEQTDNRERPEDGDQDVSQSKKDVLSEDETPDVVA